MHRLHNLVNHACDGRGWPGQFVQHQAHVRGSAFPPSKRQIQQGVDESSEPLFRCIVLRKQLTHLPQALRVVHHAPQDLSVEFQLVPEMVVDQREIHPCPVTDFAHRRSVETVFGEDFGS